MPKINEIWAYIAEDKGPDDEGVVATWTPEGWIPLIGADEARIKSHRLQAQGAGWLSGKKVKLVKFTTREDIETLPGRS